MQPGVARVDVNGRVTRQILVQIRPNALTSLGIGIDQVIAAIREANQDVPAGRLTRGQSDAVVRIEGKLKDPEQFNRIIVAQRYFQTDTIFVGILVIGMLGLIMDQVMKFTGKRIFRWAE